MKRISRWLPMGAGVSILAAAWGFGHGIEGYRHSRHALAVLGSAGMPGWGFANALLFVLPGALMMGLAWRMRSRPASEGQGWPLRMALQMALLAALGFALQGICNLDPTRLPDDGPNRLHAASWLLWWLALSLAALLAACARGLPARLRGFSLLLAFAMPLLVLGAPAWWPAALAQRFGLVLWLAWMWALERALSRGAASSPE